MDMNTLWGALTTWRSTGAFKSWSNTFCRGWDDGSSDKGDDRSGDDEDDESGDDGDDDSNDDGDDEIDDVADEDGQGDNKDNEGDDGSGDDGDDESGDDEDDEIDDVADEDGQGDTFRSCFSTFCRGWDGRSGDDGYTGLVTRYGDDDDDGSGDEGDDGSGDDGDDESGDDEDDEIDDVANEDGQGDSEDDETFDGHRHFMRSIDHLEEHGSDEVMRLEELNVVEIREDSTWLHIGSVFMASFVVELERGVSDVRAELPWTREYGCIYTAPDMFPLGWTGEVVAGASWGWEWVLEYILTEGAKTSSSDKLIGTYMGTRAALLDSGVADVDFVLPIRTFSGMVMDSWWDSEGSWEQRIKNQKPPQIIAPLPDGSFPNPSP
ncbi:hypothetical protein D8674_011167 [Pyrus ussuriensis x Pyrus communis]|uniref:Uncharacterized protein n=1 Tax=Pyrus ussuriensis x Pyrus communis TaxID=2448454 RepID=A0A5N5FXY8_9ROSA|nr:hypothetical protein D8674_011167 [Pyrus ussuriensis x Pyrus communis]